MGREVRLVPPNWDSPKINSRRFVPGEGLKIVEHYQPMHDLDFDECSQEWRKELTEWEAGERAEHKAETGEDLEYWEYCGNPPDRKDYRPWKPEDATWFQVWETVSEGTPVTPAFPTREELAQYLAKHGDYWDQHRGDGPWSIENATAFVKSGWVPSLMVANGKVFDSKECAADPCKTEASAEQPQQDQ